MLENLLIYPLYQLLIFATLGVTFIIQIIYWLNYGTIATHRNRHRTPPGDTLPEVSVVVIVGEDLSYIENGLPLLLEQEHPNFEVIAVNDCGGTSIDNALLRLQKAYPNLRFTTLKKDIRFKHSRKIPLVVGLKAARYENIIITDPNCSPSNDKWLSYFCRGFSGGGDLVIGYTGFEIESGMANRMIRASRLSMSIRYLRAAIGGHAYRGIYNNIGYTKNLFFNNRGFTHLRMSLGEDDLFVQKVATKTNTSVIINPQSTTRQQAMGGLKWWWNEQRYYTYSYRYYPTRVKINTFIELFSRSLLTASTAAAGVLWALGLLTDPLIWGSVAVALWLVREAIMINSVRRITRRLGEIKIIWSYLLYDLLSPVTEAVLAINRRVKPFQGLWIQDRK